MVSEKMHTLGTKKSTIRTIFEYGKKRAAEVGAENVYDFSKSFEAMTPSEPKTEPKEEEVPTKESAEEKPYSWLRNEDTTISKGVKEEPKEDSNVV